MFCMLNAKYINTDAGKMFTRLIFIMLLAQAIHINMVIWPPMEIVVGNFVFYWHVYDCTHLP